MQLRISKEINKKPKKFNSQGIANRSNGPDIAAGDYPNPKISTISRSENRKFTSKLSRSKNHCKTLAKDEYSVGGRRKLRRIKS